MSARSLARACGLGLFALQWLWHGVMLPPERIAPWLLALIFSLPIIPALLLWLRRHRQAGFWAAVAALGYFSHGVMEAWADPPARVLALVQAALAALLIVAASWDGMRARFRKRAG